MALSPTGQGRILQACLPCELDRGHSAAFELLQDQAALFRGSERSAPVSMVTGSFAACGVEVTVPVVVIVLITTTTMRTIRTLHQWCYTGRLLRICCRGRIGGRLLTVTSTKRIDPPKALASEIPLVSLGPSTTLK